MAKRAGGAEPPKRRQKKPPTPKSAQDIVPQAPPKRTVRVTRASDTSAERRRQALRTVMLERELNARELGRIADVNPNAIYNFLNRRAASLSPETIERLAAVLPGETVGSLQGLPDAGASPRLLIKSYVRAGEWRRTYELPEAQQESLPFPLDAGDRMHGSYGVRVEAPGAEDMFPTGTILTCVPISRWESPVIAGMRVIVQAVQGDSIEATVRDVTRAPDGSFWMRLRSSDPRFQTAVRLPAGNFGRPWREGDVRLSIAAVVTGYLVREMRFEPVATPADPEPAPETVPDGQAQRTKKPPRRKPRGS